MKFTNKLLIFWSSVFLIFLLGIITVMSLFWGITFNFWRLFIVFIINGVIPPAIITSFFYNRLEYMESKDENPPKFSGVKSMQIPFKARTNCPFDEIMQRVDREYILSYTNRQNQILKFRTDSRMLSWGIGGYIRMIDNHTMEVFVYPIHKKSRREMLLLNQTLRVLCSIFKAC